MIRKHSNWIPLQQFDGSQRRTIRDSHFPNRKPYRAVVARHPGPDVCWSGMMRSPIHWEKHKEKIHWGNFLAEFEGDYFCKMMIEFSGMGHYVYCSSMNLNVPGDFDFNVFSSMNMQTFFVLANQHWDIYTQPKRVSHPLTSSCLVIGERLSQPQRSQRRKHQQQRWWICQTCSWSSWISSGMVYGFNYGGLSRYVLRCQCFPSGI